MNTAELLGAALGLGVLSGIRLYATVLTLGLALRFDLFSLPPVFSHLTVLADSRVLAVAGMAASLEFFADKIPWIDSLWDGLHTVLRPAGALMLGSALAGGLDPEWQFAVALLTGGAALSSHSAKAATRLAVNHSPEPFSNWMLSLAGDLAVPVAAWFVATYPYVALVAASLFLIAVWWIGPRIYRLLRLELAGVAAWLRRWFGPAKERSFAAPLACRQPALAGARAALLARIEPVPEPWASKLQARGFEPVTGVRCAAGTGVDGLRHSIGYLNLEPRRLVFVARRGFRYRTVAIDLSGITGAETHTGLLFDELRLATGGGELRFALFKAPPAAETAFQPAPLAS